MNDPIGVIQTENFQQSLPLVLKTMFMANLPCSNRQFEKLKEMLERAIQFLRDATSAQNEPWAESLLAQATSFNPASVELTNMGEIVESLEALRQQIFSFMSKEELHLVTMWLYLSATRQIEPVFEENKCQIRITRSYPDERECLYQLFRQLSCDFYKDILCMYEYIISE